MPKVLATVKDKSSTTYLVQTNWPDTSNTPEQLAEFRSMYSYAYVHKDTPTKYLRQTNPELFEGAGSDDCRFKEYDQAKKLAVFLREHGRLSAGWIGEGQEQYKKLRRGPLSVRIVIESTRTTQHVLEG